MVRNAMIGIASIQFLKRHGRGGILAVVFFFWWDSDALMKRDLPYQAGTRLSQLLGAARGRSAKPVQSEPGARARILWTLGNLFMLIGVVLLAYVGGVYVQADYDRYAARGDTDVPAPVAVSAPAN